MFGVLFFAVFTVAFLYGGYGVANDGNAWAAIGMLAGALVSAGLALGSWLDYWG